MTSPVRMKVVEVDLFPTFARVRVRREEGDVHELLLDVPSGPNDVVPKLDDYLTIFVGWRHEGLDRRTR